MRPDTLTYSAEKPMSDVKHTPGPWVLDGHNLSSVIRCTVPKGHPDARHVCGDYEQIASAHGENWQANASLIAAAPDLLAALQAIGAPDEVDLVSVSDSAIRGMLYAAIRVAQDAIAKAEGRA